MATLNEFWSVLIAIVTIFLYRRFTVRGGASWRFQRWLHRRFRDFAIYFQYYTILLITLSPLAVKSVVRFRPWSMFCVSDSTGSGDGDYLELSHRLRVICSIAPYAGFVAFLVVAFHVRKIALRGLHKESFITPGDGVYYAPLQKGAIFTKGSVKYILLSVRADCDASVALFPREVGFGRVDDIPGPSYEVVLGKTQSMIRRNVAGPSVCLSWETVDANVFLDIWISVDRDDGSISVGWGRNIRKRAFMLHKDELVSEPFNFGVMADSGVAHWLFVERDEDTEEERPRYFPNQKEDMMLLMIMLPAVFAVLAMKSVIRVVEIFTTYKDNEEIWGMLIALFRADLSLAVAVEFITISSFGILCMRLISARADGVETVGVSTVWWLTMNGVGAYVLIGLTRCICIMIVLVKDAPAWQDFEAEWFPGLHLDMVASLFLHQSKQVFMFALVLLMWNMYFICKLDIIQAELPNANMKFNGVRLLVVIAQVQEGVLVPHMSQSGEQVTLIEQFKEKVPLPLQLGYISGYQGMLWHVSLLCVECLVMVLFQYVVWSKTCDRLSARLWQTIGRLFGTRVRGYSLLTHRHTEMEIVARSG
mmetsp:Transcript_8314/g.21072  ORF Transcript_8314/g.21072 Transcript_8314/m.21072 type:complete len:591 (-) Transcript_8314:179-1951(-)